MINIRDSHQYLIGLFKFEGADAGHKLLAPLHSGLLIPEKQCIFLAPLMAICMYIQTYGHLILKGFNILKKNHNFFIQ